MHRRVWIKQILIAGGGALILPACNSDAGATSVPLKNISITARQEALLADIAEAIIPATNTPGAKSLNLHQFVLKMIDDCCSQEEQEKIITGLKAFNKFSEKTAGASFSSLSPQTKLEVLRASGKEQSADGNIKFFIEQTRKWTIRGYETSQYVLTKLVPYELVPGRFEGCKKIIKSA